MSKKKIRLTLGTKILLLTLGMCVAICAVALSGTYFALQTEVQEHAEDICLSLSERIAPIVSAAELDDFAEGDRGEAYEALMSGMQACVDKNWETQLTIITPKDEDWVLVAQAAAQPRSANRKPGQDADLSDSVRQKLKSLSDGNFPVPLVREETVTTFYPILDVDGSLVGCIICELDAGSMIASVNEKLVKLALVLGVVVLAVMLGYMLVVRGVVVRPIRQLTDAVQAYEGGENKESLRKLVLKGSDELQSLADAFRMMLVEIDLRGFEERELAVREERVEAELKLTTAINAAMTPKALPAISYGRDFDVRGLSDQTSELSCDFYDYFLLEDGRLCLVMGSVPSQDVSAALFMVVAKTTIKNQLRAGISILDAVTRANRQLYEVGQGMLVHALVGVLDRKGVFSFVNAGQELPFLMRAQDRFERLQGPVYVPLGQNENVSYREQSIQLLQGDRLFFHTAGLSQVQGKDGHTFGEQQMQAVLNVSRGKNLDIERLLGYMQYEGKAFADSHRRCSGFSMMALDYLRRRKELAHCVVDRDRVGAMRMADFLKRQLSENGFTLRTAAHLVVLADEVFALCCRQRTEGLVTVECEVDQADGAVILRLKSPFAGCNPLENKGGGDTENALDFIQRNTREITFHKGEFQDVLVLVIDIRDTAN